MDSEDMHKPKSGKRQKKEIKQNGNQSWDELDGLEQGNLEELASQKSSPGDQKKEAKPKVDRKAKKVSEIQEYQKALARLRSENKMFHKPFDKQRLNLSTMQAIKMLKDAIERDKDFTKTLRNMGCKTRMRARNKTAARELFGVMLKYLEQGMVPEWMRQRHKQLLLKDDNKFDNFMRVQEKDWQ